jgi:hypothetical protein
MKSCVPAAAVTIVALLAIGCSSAPGQAGQGAAQGGALSVAGLRPGMTAQEARAAAGEPVSIEQQDCATGQTVWRFADGGVAILRDGRIAFHYP